MVEDRYPAARRYAAADTGAPFPVGLCKQQTRLAFSVPSDGSGSASVAWSRTKRRVNLTTENWRGGVLVWHTGGSKGYGHVCFTDAEPGFVWTVDYPNQGHWNRVKLTALEWAWANLTRAGFSLDIDGVQVVPALPLPETGWTRTRREVLAGVNMILKATRPDDPDVVGLRSVGRRALVVATRAAAVGWKVSWVRTKER